MDSIGHSSSIYGLHKDTISSILLTMLPPLEHDYCSNRFKLPTKSTPAYEVRNRVMEMTLEALKKNAGFVIPEVREGGREGGEGRGGEGRGGVVK